MSGLVAKGLAKQYGKRQVVKDMSISVERGEIVGLLGPTSRQNHQFLRMIKLTGQGR